MKKTLLTIVISLTLSCATSVGPERIIYDSRLASVTSYPVKTPMVTPAGFHYGGTLDPIALDYAIGKVESCLHRIPEPTPAEKDAMECLRPELPMRRDVRTELFNVMVAPDWGYVMCHREQGFTCGIDPKYCLQKGVTPTDDCPCRCRATVQGGRTVVTTPDLKLFPAELTRLVTGCNVVWNGPLSECAASVL